MIRYIVAVNCDNITQMYIFHSADMRAHFIASIALAFPDAAFLEIEEYLELAA